MLLSFFIEKQQQSIDANHNVEQVHGDFTWQLRSRSIRTNNSIDDSSLDNDGTGHSPGGFQSDASTPPSSLPPPSPTATLDTPSLPSTPLYFPASNASPASVPPTPAYPAADSSAPPTPLYFATMEVPAAVGVQVPWQQSHPLLHPLDCDSIRARIEISQLILIAHFWELCSRGARFKKDKDLNSQSFVQICERPVPVFVFVGSDTGQDIFIKNFLHELAKYDESLILSLFSFLLF